MTTKLHKAYSKNKNAFYYYECECANIIVARNDANPKSCGCKQNKPRRYNEATQQNELINIIPNTHKRCYMCKEKLTIDSFHKGCNRCKECSKEYKRNNSYKSKDKTKEYSHNYRLRKKGITEEEYIKIKEDRRLRIEENKQKALSRQIKFNKLKERQEVLKVSSTKQCVKCSEIKPKSAFFKSKGNIDGYDNRCKECEKIRLREQRGYELTRARTPEEIKIRKKLNKHKRRFIEQQGKIKPKEIRELKEKQKDRCYWCYKDISKAYHIDHYIPLSKGGEHLIENIVLACPSCNMSKHDKDPLEFANKQGRLL